MADEKQEKGGKNSQEKVDQRRDQLQSGPGARTAKEQEILDKAAGKR